LINFHKKKEKQSLTKKLQRSKQLLIELTLNQRLLITKTELIQLDTRYQNNVNAQSKLLTSKTKSNNLSEEQSLPHHLQQKEILKQPINLMVQL